MTLLSTARALDDRNFVWRVGAACMKHAANFANMTGNDKNYAIAVLMRPQTVESSMLAFVAIDPAVSSAVVADEDGSVDTSAVSDDDISRVVSARWSLVATKYPTNPLVQAAP